MWEQGERESGGVEVRPEEKPLDSGVEEASTGPRLFSELETGITAREVVIPTIGEAEEDAEVPEADDGRAPSPPILIWRRKGGPFPRADCTPPWSPGRRRRPDLRTKKWGGHGAPPPPD